MTTGKHHDITPPPVGTNSKKDPANPHAQRPSAPTSVTRGETSPQKVNRKATDH